MTEKNGSVKIKIDRLGVGGEGVARLEDGRVLFVNGVCVGEDAEVKLLSVKKKFAYGKVQRILSASPDRVVPPCPVFGKCGGCQLQHIRYAAQCDYKRETVRQTLLRIGGVEADVAPTKSGEREYGYRNKIQLPVGTDKEGRTVIGFYRANSHDIVPIEACPLHGDWATKLIACVKKYMAEAQLSGYDERTKRGDVRHVVARFLDGKVYVCVVTPLSELPRFEVLKKILDSTFSSYSLLSNTNREDTNVILGVKTVLLSGESRLSSEWLGIKFSLAVPSFLQVNSGLAQTLYEDVISRACVTEEDVLIDAYSGAGILSACLARSAKRVYGVEICKEASLDADALKRENGIDNLYNVNGDCAEIVPPLLNALRSGQGFLPGYGAPCKVGDARLTVVLDPPRKGCDERVLSAILLAAPKKLVYVSCNPSTLARDLKMLCAESYEAETVTPYDLFPQTCHVETLVVLRRKI